MKHLFFFAAFLLFSFPAATQHYCGFDELRQKLFETHRLTPAAEQHLNETMLSHFLSGLDVRGGGGDVLVVPVVIHIIHNNGNENIPDEQVGEALEDLNDAFANTGDYFQEGGIETGIQFCLAQRDPDGNFSTGINRVEHDLTTVVVPSQDEALKDIVRWDTQEYLNIWVVKEIIREEGNAGVIGYATFPDAHGSNIDGLVIEAAYFGSTNDGSKVIVHECGHYLGLYHTFEGGCFNNNCQLDGDRVCDTPPDSHTFNNLCFDGTNSCDTDDDDLSANNPFRPTGLGGLGDQFDMQENYMDYSNLVCFRMFTPGQRDRMQAALLEVRTSLLDGQQCTAPCENPFVGDVTTSATTMLSGESITFTNNSSGFNAVQWLVNEEAVANSANFIFTTTQQGLYEIVLEMTNEEPGCTQIFEFLITVICPIDVSFTASATSVPEGGTVDFENETTGATSYAWLVDDEEESNNENFTFTFIDAGGHSVYLTAGNGLCTVQSPPVYISVGSCTSGNENNIWHWFNPDGNNAYGFNFNQDPAGYIPENNLPPGIAHCKATHCDEAGNLLFVSTGIQVLDKNYDVMPNGDQILGHISAHFGTLFMKKPGSTHEYYLFTSGAQENFSDGLRYSIIDGTLNGGLGDVTDVKNVFIETIQTENFACVRHCNLDDFWLVFYDGEESVFKSYLVDESGIASTPVISDADVLLDEVSIAQVIRVSPKGDKLIYNRNLLDFDAATGELALVHTFSFDLALNYDFSSNQRYIYYTTGEINVWLRQYDITLPADEIEDSGQTMEFSGLDIFGQDMKLGPDGKIYLEEPVSGYISVINNPNAQFEDINFVNNALDVQAFINSFGNSYHAYISGKTLWIEGEDEVCSGEENHYNVYGHQCLTGEINWQVLGNASSQQADEGILLAFDEPGEIILVAQMETACGTVSDSLHINVVQAPVLDLGPDMNICQGNSLTLDAGPGWDSYLWQNGSTEQTLITNNTGLYSVVVTLGSCTLTDEVHIENLISPFLDLGPDFEVCDQEIVLLDASQFEDPVWQDGTASAYYTVYDGGTYWVTCTQPCFATDTVYVDACGQSIGVEETRSQGISIFPNPGSGIFTLELDEYNGSMFKIEVIDYSGRLAERISAPATDGRLKVDISHLASGAYTLRVSTNTNAVIVKLLLLN